MERRPTKCIYNRAEICPTSCDLNEYAGLTEVAHRMFRNAAGAIGVKGSDFDKRASKSRFAKILFDRIAGGLECLRVSQSRQS